MSSTKSKCLSLSEKVKLLEEIDNGARITYLSKKYGIAKSTVCKIKLQKNQIINAARNGFGDADTRKTLKKANHPIMEETLYKWYLTQTENHVSVNAQMFKERAKILHQKFKENENFIASDGWLQRFKTRFGLRFPSISGEKLSPHSESVNPFQERLMAKINELQLDLNQIYNAEETCLYWKRLPYTAVEHQRIALLACTNATGLHKLTPLITGETMNHTEDCPMGYEYFKSPDMTSEIFQNWFYNMFIPQVKQFLKSQNLQVKALLLLDNTSSCFSEVELKNEDGTISAMVMPPNVTPLDHNVTRITKLYYRKFLLSFITKPKNSITDITLKDAVLMWKLAWDSLEPNVIEKCWRNILSKYILNDEDHLPLDVLREQCTSETIDNIIHAVLELINELNPDVRCTHDEIKLWNEDVQVKLEHDVEDCVDDCVNESYADLTGKVITDFEAIEIFNQALIWAEQNGASSCDLMVLERLRSRAVDNSSRKQ